MAFSINFMAAMCLLLICQVDQRDPVWDSLPTSVLCHVFVRDLVQMGPGAMAQCVQRRRRAGSRASLPKQHDGARATAASRRSLLPERRVPRRPRDGRYCRSVACRKSRSTCSSCEGRGHASGCSAGGGSAPGRSVDRWTRGGGRRIITDGTWLAAMRGIAGLGGSRGAPRGTEP